MFFRWKKGLPNQSQGRKAIPVTTEGGIGMYPGKIYQFDENDEASGSGICRVLQTIESVEVLSENDEAVLEFLASLPKPVESDVVKQKAKKVISVADDAGELDAKIGKE